MAEVVITGTIDRPPEKMKQSIRYVESKLKQTAMARVRVTVVESETGVSNDSLVKLRVNGQLAEPDVVEKMAAELLEYRSHA